MEKIYMNENNGSGQKKKLSSKYHFSIVLSFVVAAFAIVSLIVVGFDQISFAAEGDSSGDSFVVHYYPSTTENYAQVYTKEGDNGDGVGIMGAGDFTDLSNFVPVFCIGKRSQSPNSGGTYTKSVDGEVAQGIAYILNKSNINNPNSSIIPMSIKDTLNDTGYDKNIKYKILEYYATQVAIWLYLSDEDLFNNGNMKDVYFKETGYQLELRHGDNPTVIDLYNGSLSQYITAVASDAQTNPIKSVDVKFADDSISAVDGTNYYQTSAITVTGSPSGDLISYELSLDGIEGAILVNDKGEEIKDYKNLSPSDKFYVRFPKDKLDNEKKVLNVTASGTFSYVKPYKYTLSGYQDVVKVENDTLVQSASTYLDVVNSPDTGMSISKTIYFIGLIVLLCGVGIIYANSKPLKNM